MGRSEFKDWDEGIKDDANDFKQINRKIPANPEEEPKGPETFDEAQRQWKKEFGSVSEAETSFLKAIFSVKTLIFLLYSAGSLGLINYMHHVA